MMLVLPGCECIGIDAELAPDTPENNALIDAGYGSYCHRWDNDTASPYSDFCWGADHCEPSNNWCALEWCYVPETCPTAQPSDAIPGVGIWFSYETCGNPDCFSIPDHQNCPWDPDGSCASITNLVEQFLWWLFLTPCESHDDCASEPDNNVFCYEGYCNTCDECQFCIDGIDNTCSPCDASIYPLFEESENCLSVSETCGAYLPETSLTFENAELLRANLDCIQNSTDYCEILYGSMGTTFNATTGLRTNISLRISMADGYEGTYACQGSEDGTWLLDTGNPQSPNQPLPRCIDNLWISNEFEMGSINIAPTDEPQRLKFEIIDENRVVQPFNILSMTFLDIDGANSLQEVVVLHDVSEATVADPTFVLVENANQDPFFWNLGAGTSDVFVRNDHTRCCGPRCSDPECDDTSDPTNTCDDMNTCQVNNPTTIAQFNRDTFKQAVSAAAIWRSSDVENPLYSFEVSMWTHPDAQGSGGSGRTMHFWGFSSALVPETCTYCDTGFDLSQCTFGAKSGVEDILCERGSLNLCNEDTCCEQPVSTAHGDPIIWTFNDECYDLNRDGTYLATSHPKHGHDVWLSVYNDFIRDVYVIEKSSGDIVLGINSLGHVINNYPYRFTDDILKCPEGKVSEHSNECIDTYREWSFDALDFRFYVQLLRHDYLDQGLKDGELGYHLDVYPEPYKRFHQEKPRYTGLYFENPLPEELAYCPGGSENGDSERRQ